MSARSHVDVSERRLRPIYDSLDYGNNKKAIQEADKVLKKQKDFTCAKVLKALALLRLGRKSESMTLLQEVHNQSPTDEATLQAMVICYRELQRLDLIADIYAKAHKAKPDSEDILTALFMAYVRIGDYKKQQQTAMALHRLKPTKNPYYFWAVMSVFMQAITDEKLGPSMLLPLAERMTQKYVVENKIDGEAEVRMYLIILEEMKKYDVALGVINGPLGEKLTSEVNFVKKESARLLMKLERWPEANAAYRKLLQQEPDQWNFYTEYFKSFFKLREMNWSAEDNSKYDCSPEDPVDNTFEKTVKFLELLKSQTESAERPLRGPYLAQLELVHQASHIKSSEQDMEILGNPLDLFVQYYKKFGDKYCCFSDLRTYLVLLDAKQKSQLLEQLEAECPPALDSKDETVSCSEGAKALQKHLTVVQLARHLGQHQKLDYEQRLKIVEDLLHRYQNGLGFGKKLTATEFQYSDPYICVIAHLLCEGWSETGDWSLLWQAVLILEMALQNSPCNFQLKLLLIKMYGQIGAFGPCRDLYASLEIKFIQNDALGYVIANHVVRLGHFNSAGTLFDSMLRFFTQNHKDTTEHLISSYKYGSFTKVREFIKFRERLQNSMQYASATAERLLLDMMLETSNHSKTEDVLTCMDIDPEKDHTAWQDLRDNRDLFMMPSWDPPNNLSVEELHKKSFQEETAWLKVRNLTIRCMVAAVKLGLQAMPKQAEADGAHNDVNNGEQSKQSLSEVLQQLAQQLAEHIDYCRTVDIPEYPLAGPFRTRLSTFLSTGVGQLLLDGIACVLYIQNLHDHGQDKTDQEKEDIMKCKLPQRLAELIAQQRGPLVVYDDNKVTFHPEKLENIVHLTEVIGFLTLLVGVCHQLLKPMKVGKRGRKKKDQSHAKPAVFVSFQALVEGMLKCVDNLRQSCSENDALAITEQMKSLKISVKEELIKDISELQINTRKKVWKSYEESFKDIESYLNHKSKYLNSLNS